MKLFVQAGGKVPLDIWARERLIGYLLDKPEVYASLLARQVSSIPVAEIESVEEVYPVLLSSSALMRDAAYNILLQHIVGQQEHISMEVALAKDGDDFKPEIAPELLSLILDTPSLERIEDLILGLKVQEPALDSIRAYFLAWRLIFAHFDGSARPRTPYIQTYHTDMNNRHSK